MLSIFSLIAVVILLHGVVGDTCENFITQYSEKMSTCVCHQTAAVLFANFEGIRMKTLPLSDNSVTIDKFQEEVFSEGPSTAWMATIWQYVDNNPPFAPHSFVIHRSTDRIFRLYTSYCDAYSGGYSLNEWLVQSPWYGWSVFAGKSSFNETDFKSFFDFSAISYNRLADTNDRVTADWDIWRPDSLQGFNISYSHSYTADTYYQVSYYTTSSPVSDEKCLLNVPVVQEMSSDCFSNSQTCIQF